MGIFDRFKRNKVTPGASYVPDYSESAGNVSVYLTPKERRLVARKMWRAGDHVSEIMEATGAAESTVYGYVAGMKTKRNRVNG